jgi:transposase
VIDLQRETIEALRATLEEQSRQIAELTALLKKRSSNSDKPPSSDPPGAPPSKPRARSGRKRGGQPGHDKHERALVPLEQVDSVQALKPDYCRACSHPLVGADAEPHRHQVIEIPRIAPVVSEYQLHTLDCQWCGIRTRALLPDGVPTRNFGPRLQAMVSVASGSYRMSKRTIEEMLEDFFGVEISLGSIANLEQATSDALVEPVAEVAQEIKQSPVVHADETGWYQRSKRAWLWVVATTQLACFLVSYSRGAKIAKQLLGEAFKGFLVSDRWAAYEWVDVRRRQLCWAHLIRQFIGFQDYGGKAKRLGRALELRATKMFRMWHQVRDGTLSRARFRLHMLPIKRAVLAHLRACARLPVGKVAGRAREILALEPALWTFITQRGIEPTNNHAERLVRHGVLWRKSSFGTDSEAGSRFVERILTTVATLRLQNRNVLDYLEQACRAALIGQRPASLLPAPVSNDPPLAQTA